MVTVTRPEPHSQPDKDHRFGVAAKTLGAGGGFAALIAGILGAAGAWGLGDRVVLYALVALCVLAALTMFTAAAMTRRA